MRTTLDGERSKVSTRRFINRNNWDSKATKAKGYKAEVKQLNQHLEKLKATLHDYHSEMIKLGDHIPAQSLKNKFL